MRIIAFCSCVVLLSGCASTYKHSTLAEPNAKLERGKTVLIATPTNGSYESKEYQNSGKMTASAVRAAFARRNLGHDYYVVPEILHWEDRATEWSGIPDRIEVKISIFDIDRKETASAVISGKSKWATFGGDHPQDLLPEPMNTYIESLYR